MVIEACASQILFRPSTIHNNIAHRAPPLHKRERQKKQSRFSIRLWLGNVGDESGLMREAKPGRD